MPINQENGQLRYGKDLSIKKHFEFCKKTVLLHFFAEQIHLARKYYI